MLGMKHPFDIDRAIERIRQAVRPYPKAAMFALAEEGFSTPFELLVACIISIRTRDEVTLVSARRLFGLARTPAAMGRLSAAQGCNDEGGRRRPPFFCWPWRRDLSVRSESSRRVRSAHHLLCSCDRMVRRAHPTR